MISTFTAKSWLHRWLSHCQTGSYPASWSVSLVPGCSLWLSQRFWDTECQFARSFCEMNLNPHWLVSYRVDKYNARRSRHWIDWNWLAYLQYNSRAYLKTPGRAAHRSFTSMRRGSYCSLISLFFRGIPGSLILIRPRPCNLTDCMSAVWRPHAVVARRPRPDRPAYKWNTHQMRHC